MATGRYGFPARLEPDEEGRLVVHFPDLPEALTDGANEAQALAEAADVYPRRSPAASIGARRSRLQAAYAAGSIGSPLNRQ